MLGCLETAAFRLMRRAAIYASVILLKALGDRETNDGKDRSNFAYTLKYFCMLQQEVQQI